MGDDGKDCKDPECSDGEMIAIGPNLGGVVPFVRHRADHKVEHGVGKIVQAGEQTPEMKNPVVLMHRRDNLFDVKPMSKGGSDRAMGKSHSRAATPAYCDNWDMTFGKKPPVGQA